MSNIISFEDFGKIESGQPQLELPPGLPEPIPFEEFSNIGVDDAPLTETEYNENLPFQITEDHKINDETFQRMIRLNELATGKEYKYTPEKWKETNHEYTIRDDRRAMLAGGFDNPADYLAELESEEGSQNLIARTGGEVIHGLVEGTKAIKRTVLGEHDLIRAGEIEEAWDQSVKALKDEESYFGEFWAGAIRKTGGVGGRMAPAIGAGIITKNPYIAYAAISGQVGTESYGSVRAKGWDRPEALLYGAGAAGIELASMYAGGKVAGRFGLSTFEEALVGTARKTAANGVGKLTKVVGGAAVEGGEELLAEVGQSILDVQSNADPDSWKNLTANDYRGLREIFTIGVLAGGGASAIREVNTFLAEPSRKNAQALGIPEDLARTKADRDSLVEQVSNLLSAKGFREMLSGLVEQGSMTEEQSRYYYYLVEARARASDLTPDQYIGRRLKGVEAAKWKDWVDQDERRKKSKYPWRAEVDIEDNLATIRAFERADFSSLIHEFGHLMRQDLRGMGEDMKGQAARLFGAERTAKGWKWTEAAEEKFAKAWETYMTEGVAPNAELGRLFAKTSEWMEGAYKASKRSGSGVELNPEMREFFDKFFDIDAAVANRTQQEAAEASAGLMAEEGALEPLRVRNADIDQRRVERGLEPIVRPLERSTNPETWNAMLSKVASDPTWQPRLIQSITEDPKRGTNQEEHAGLALYLVTQQFEHDVAMEEYAQAIRSQDDARIQETKGKLDDKKVALDQIEQLWTRVGSTAGATLQFRKIQITDDYSLGKIVNEFTAAKGEELTEAEVSEAKELSDKLQDKAGELKDIDSGKKVPQDELEAVDDIINETKKKKKRKGKKTKADKPDPPEDTVEDLLAKIKQKIDTDNEYAITPYLRRLAALLVEQGIDKRAPLLREIHGMISPFMPEGWTKEITRRALSGYGNVPKRDRTEAQKRVAEIGGELQQALKIFAVKKKRDLEGTGPPRRGMSDAERRLIKKLNELKKKYGVNADSALKSALQARQTYYENRIKDTEYEIEKKRRIIRQKTSEEDQKAVDPEGYAEMERLKAEYRELLERRNSMKEFQTELTEEQLLERATKSAQRDLDRWEQRLGDAKKGTWDYLNNRKRQYTSAELDAIRARRDQVKAELDELRTLADPNWREDFAQKQLLSRMLKQVADLKQKIAEEDFAPPPKRTKREPTGEGAKVQAELMMLRKELADRIEKYRRSQLTWLQSAWEHKWVPYDIFRNFMTTGEFSFVFRQGKWNAITTPRVAWKGLRDAIRVFTKKNTLAEAMEVEAEMERQPLYKRALAVGLPLSPPGASLNKQEEFMVGDYSETAPFISRFNNAGRVHLNSLRFGAWRTLRDAFYDGNPTQEQDEWLASFVADMTGRSGLGKHEGSAVMLGRFFFSFRFILSRLRLVTLMPLWTAPDWRSRQLAASQYAKFLTGMYVYYTMLSWALGDDEQDVEIETNPRSSDYLKIRIGDTRLDPLAGLQQFQVVIARSITGETKTLSGKTNALRGQDVPFGGDTVSDKWWDFIKTKAHPTPGLAIRVFDQRDMIGRPVTLTNTAMDMLTPITWGDVWRTFEENDVDDATILSLLAFFGEGLAVYEEKKKKK